MGANKKIKRKIHRKLEKKFWKRICELEEMNKNLNRLVQGSILNEMIKDIHRNNLEKQFQGLLSICSSCKKIKDKKGYWNLLESYIESHSDVEFTHGICPECSDKLYGKENWYMDLKNRKNI